MRGWLELGLSLLLAVSLLEGTARVALRGSSPLRPWVLGGDGTSHRLEWVDRQRRSRSPHEFQYIKERYEPTRGWTNRSNLAIEIHGKNVTTNARGLRGATDYGYERDPTRRRILLLGDSFTFGNEVSDDETFAHQLGELLPDTEIVNLGVSAYGHDQMLVYLEEEGIRYRPDIVLLGFVSSDIDRNAWDFFIYAKPTARVVDGSLRWTNLPVPAPEEVLQQDAWRSRFGDLLRLLSARVQERLGWADREAEELTVAILNGVREVVDDQGARLILAYLPAFSEAAAPAGVPIESEQFFFEYCNHARVECFSLRPGFVAAAERGVQFETKRHWTAVGHRTVARGIARYLSEDRVDPVGIGPSR